VYKKNALDYTETESGGISANREVREFIECDDRQATLFHGIEDLINSIMIRLFRELAAHLCDDNCDA